ncbi:oxygenase MpaB family protein [Streptomyces diastatochromogenes]|uniref:oxygenase MpaB family protein n=1 Tax=Streptomyces diastatochromogenes TaxID=42236 RepID=UPI002F262863
MAGDPGLFGPRSVTWQLHADPMMWIAGVRALHLQALHPRAVRGVLQNSAAFRPDAQGRRDAWGRLMRTADFVGTLSYGTTDAAERAGAAVRGRHRRLTATDPATGARYRIDEPELLRWVHCAEVDSYLQVLRRSGYPLTDRQADRYLDEQRTSARLVGLDPDTVPGDRAALAAYFERIRPDLAGTDEAHQVDAFLRRPPVPDPLAPARALLWRPVADLAYATLPGYAHRLYGRLAPPPATTTRRLRTAGRLLRAVPPALRWRLPPRHVLRAVARLGPAARPGTFKLRDSAAILDGHDTQGDPRG